MRILDEHNAVDYLRDVGWIDARADVRVSPLPGGVSNQVLYVNVADARDADFVLKQARPRLRVADPWFCGVERIWREVEVLKTCQQLLEIEVHEMPLPHESNDTLVACTPKVLHEDRDNFAFAMTAAPPTHVVWKHELLAGRIDRRVAAACGTLLGRLHAASWQNPAISQRLADRTVFDELRLDPYYRTVARNRSDAAPHFHALVENALANPCALVHADFSPKNLLVYPAGLMMVDFETGHYGDPAFDLGFFLSHLLLKGVYHRATPTGAEPLLELADEFWSSYRTVARAAMGSNDYADLVQRGALHCAGCLWARVDGKSRVEYLTDEAQRESVRALACEILERRPAQWADVVPIFRQAMKLER